MPRSRKASTTRRALFSSISITIARDVGRGSRRLLAVVGTGGGRPAPGGPQPGPAGRRRVAVPDGGVLSQPPRPRVPGKTGAAAALLCQLYGSGRAVVADP